MRIVTLKDPYAGTITSDIADGTYLGAAVTAWSGTSSYAVGDIRCDTTTRPHYVYKCKSIVTHTTGTEPRPSLDDTRWTLIGTTDRDAEFDDLIGTQSFRTTSHTVTVDASGTNYVVFYNLDATSITLTLTNSIGVVKTETINLKLPMSAPSWWAYFCEDSKTKKQLSWKYPKYATSTLTVTINTFAESIVKCGVFRWGSASGEIGAAQKGITTTLMDYSTKGTIYNVTAGPSADNIDLTMYIPVSSVDGVRELFRQNIAKVAVYDCNNGDENDLESFVLLALYKSFTRVFEYKGIVKCNISLQGVI